MNIFATVNCSRSFGEAQDIVSKAGKELTKREIVLVDQSAAEVSALNVLKFFLGVDQ